VDFHASLQHQMGDLSGQLKSLLETGEAPFPNDIKDRQLGIDPLQAKGGL